MTNEQEIKKSLEVLNHFIDNIPLNNIQGKDYKAVLLALNNTAEFVDDTFRERLQSKQEQKSPNKSEIITSQTKKENK